MVYLIYTLDGYFTGFVCSSTQKAQEKCDYLVSIKQHMNYTYERVILDQ